MLNSVPFDLSPPRAMQDHSPAPLIAVSTFAVGALVANIYYAQPLIAQMAPAVGISPELGGAVVSVTQIGYGLGLFLLVPLADLIENRRLVIGMLACSTVALACLAMSQDPVTLLGASFLVGLCSCAAQVLVPFVAHRVPPQRRGRVIGGVMAGLLSGIMLARPLALLVSGLWGWRAVFWLSCLIMVGTGAALLRVMPAERAGPGHHYGRLLGSMLRLARDSRLLRQRALYQGLLFAAFNMFWTAVPLLLAERFGLDQYGIALFALAGAGGALAAPLAGRLADRGLIAPATGAAGLVSALAFLGSIWAAAGSVWAMAVLSVILDAAVQTNQVVGQRVIFSAPGPLRGRVNGIYMTGLFAAGAAGSLLGTVTYHWGGWTMSGALGVLLAAGMFGSFLAERRPLPHDVLAQAPP